MSDKEFRILRDQILAADMSERVGGDAFEYFAMFNSDLPHDDFTWADALAEQIESDER